MKILFVCMGNICRSPTAEAVFRGKAAAAGLGSRVTVDSAGTHGFHVGDPPDRRAQQAAQRRGYDMSPLRGRRVADADFERFDLLLAMDEENLELLRERCPEPHADKVRLLLSFATKPGTRPDVPDPYYGNAQGFENVLDLIEDAADGLLAHVRQRLDANG
jgi:protein-tyrosine phosphatase